MGFLWFDPAALADNFAQDIPVRDAQVLAAVQKPIAARCSIDPAGPPAWRTLPSWYLVSTQDNAIPPEAERFMARRANAATEAVDGSHAAFIAHPDVAAALILKAVAAARG
ncbi:MAG TPA: alpha/beta hydrolase [Jatrophihabitantaceae bacterium]